SNSLHMLKPQEIMMSPEGDDALNAKFRLGTHPSEKNKGFPTAWILQDFTATSLFRRFARRGLYVPMFPAALLALRVAPSYPVT
ncbi:hypothetical protein, partial [Paenibacillus dendritiformis]|uniref:hypothetical protein n=1 Tax=Paenibacillus dendritiformis TaxID=130049 RepID=UPI000DB1929B